jgi:acetamidase/formamidase
MVISSSAEFEVDMPTFVSGSAWTEMGKGDPKMEEMYEWTEDGPKINMRGPTGNSGGHFMTGPIYVCGAEPGDVLQVDIVDLVPRPNPGYDNRSFGITINSGIGWFARDGYITPGYQKSRSVNVVYEAIKDSAGRAQYWEPQYSFDIASPQVLNKQPGCVPRNGSIPNTTDAGAGTWSNPDYVFGSRTIPCTPEGQDFTFPNTGYSGQLQTVPESIRDYSIKGAWRVPVNMHIGNMGLAPKVGAPVITSPPMRTGGNIDNKRIGIGASMYYPVEQVGALLSMGDCHGAQGDGESSGTGIETSLNGKFKVTLHKKDNLPQVLKPVNYPLLENANEWVINGYAYADWLREIPNPQVNVSKTYPYGGVDFNRAMAVVYNETREFVMNAFFPNKTGAEDFAINVMSNVIDFGITQIVDSNIGFHSIIPKWPFNASAWEDEPYYQAKNKCGTSRAEYP